MPASTRPSGPWPPSGRRGRALIRAMPLWLRSRAVLRLARRTIRSTYARQPHGAAAAQGPGPSRRRGRRSSATSASRRPSTSAGSTRPSCSTLFALYDVPGRRPPGSMPCRRRPGVRDRRHHRPPPGARGAAPGVTRMRQDMRASVGGLWALMLVVAAGLASRRRRGRRERLLVVPFENAGRDGRLFWVSEGAATLLTGTLESMGVGAVSRERTPEGVRAAPVAVRRVAQRSHHHPARRRSSAPPTS